MKSHVLRVVPWPDGEFQLSLWIGVMFDTIKGDRYSIRGTLNETFSILFTFTWTIHSGNQCATCNLGKLKKRGHRQRQRSVWMSWVCRHGYTNTQNQVQYMITAAAAAAKQLMVSLCCRDRGCSRPFVRCRCLIEYIPWLMERRRVVQNKNKRSLVRLFF